MLATRLFGSPKGKKPKPWDHQLHNPYTDTDRPIAVEREGELLRRLKNSQRLMAGVVVAVLLAGVNQWRMTDKIQPQIVRMGVMEVLDGEPPRPQALLPRHPTNLPSDNLLVFVIRYWLWNLRTVGDSEVLLGQAWQWAQAFTDEKLLAWFREQVIERHSVYKKHQTVQITKPVVLPLSKTGRTYKASWEEVTYAQSGEPLKKKKWEATFTLKVSPPQTLQQQQQWRNDLGIVITEVHPLELN